MLPNLHVELAPDGQAFRQTRMLFEWNRLALNMASSRKHADLQKGKGRSLAPSVTVLVDYLRAIVVRVNLDISSLGEEAFIGRKRRHKNRGTITIQRRSAITPYQQAETLPCRHIMGRVTVDLNLVVVGAVDAIGIDNLCTRAV